MQANRVAAVSLQALSLLLLAGPWPAWAQADYPSKPVRLIVPYPPGGGGDVGARLISQKLSPALGQQVVVDNRGGGNTVIGNVALVKAAPDGYTLEFVTTAHGIVPNLQPVPYDPVKDFAPVATLMATQQLMLVNVDLPAKTLKEFIALAKSREGMINYGTTGTGTSNDMSAALLSMVADIKMLRVPYQGAAPVITDLMAGRVQMFMNSPLPMEPLVKAGKLRALAISGDKRMASLPDVPTFAEAGLPGFVARGWQGVVAPARTPPAIIGKVSQEMTRMLRAPDVLDTIASFGAEPLITTPQQFGELIKTELARNAEIIKHAGMKAD